MQCALVVAGIIWQCKLHVKAQSSVSSQAKKKPGQAATSRIRRVGIGIAHKKPIKQTALKLTLILRINS